MKGLRKLLTLVLFGFLAVSIAACNNVGDTPNGENVGSFASYDELKAYLEEVYQNSNNNYYYMNGGGILFESATAMDGVVTTTTASMATDSSTRDYSTTNNQVEGVEESDRIITDGYHIYIASGSMFLIVNADTLEIEYSFQLENGNIEGIYVYQDRVVLLSYEYEYLESDSCFYYIYDGEYVYTEDVDASGDDTDTLIDPETTTAYQGYCVDWMYTYGTGVRIFDTSDSENVEMVRELYFDSTYLTDSRMIDEQLYLVMNNYMYYYGMQEDGFIPKYSDSAISDELVNVPIDSIYFMPNDGESFSYLILSSLDVTDDQEEANIKTYLGSSYRIYMSENNLYATIYRWIYDDQTNIYTHFTHIMRFEIVDGELQYKAIAKVLGSPLNQFSMDEYDGVFRIATTSYTYTNEGSIINNSLYLLDATSDETMNLISTLDGLGKPNERIYAVRYSEDIAYVVTFVNTDPLYKLDLSDPENPKILGELYEDGVSDYLHIIADNLMIGIGRAAEEIDGWTRFTGVKVSLYDTTGDTPINLETYLVEGEYSYTNVAYDHKAFLSFTPQGADFTYVAIPVSEYYDGYWTYSQSMYLFKVYHTGDLEFITKLTNMTEDEEGYYRYFDTIERAVIIDNYVYTLSYSSIHMFDMNNDFAAVNSLEFNPNYYYYWGYYVD